MKYLTLSLPEVTQAHLYTLSKKKLPYLHDGLSQLTSTCESENTGAELKVSPNTLSVIMANPVFKESAFHQIGETWELQT